VHHHHPQIPLKHPHFSPAVCSTWDKGYRFGFNGKEIDKGEEGMGGGGSTYDYGFRIYNPSLGRFLSVDPLFKSYPWYTPYQFAGNKPIWAIDLDGLEEKIVTSYLDASGKKITTVLKSSDYNISDWKLIQSSLFGSYSIHEKTTGYNWTSGFKNYVLGMGSNGKNQNGWVGPGKGTLIIDATGKVTKISFNPQDDKTIKGNKPPTISESLSLAWQGFKVFFLSPDKNVEGSEKFNKTFNNFLTGVSLAFGAGELKAAYEFWNTAGVINDINDLISASDYVTDPAAKAAISSWKTITAIKNLEGGLVDVVTNGNTVKKSVSGALDSKDALDLLKLEPAEKSTDVKTEEN
jgi:RHS repeat-associated protein